MADYDYGGKFIETIKSAVVWTIGFALFGVITIAGVTIYNDPPKEWPKKILRADGLNCIRWDKKTFCEVKEQTL